MVSFALTLLFHLPLLILLMQNDLKWPRIKRLQPLALAIPTLGFLITCIPIGHKKFDLTLHPLLMVQGLLLY